LFSNSVAPPIVAASLKVLELLQESTELRDRLFTNAVRFRQKMKANGFQILEGEHPIIPVMFGDAFRATKMAEALLAKGVYVVGFSYPVVPQGRARIRVQVSAGHAVEELDFAAAQFVAAEQEMAKA
jgi:glycine C-acetyltransferase